MKVVSCNDLNPKSSLQMKTSSRNLHDCPHFLIYSVQVSSQRFNCEKQLLSNLTHTDYWLTSSHLFDYVNSVDIVSAIKTDHSAITIEIQVLQQEVKGPGFWKLNTVYVFIIEQGLH